MDNYIKISNGHSSIKNPTFEVKLQGTNPTFGFIWINDEIYEISKSNNSKSFQIKKVKTLS